MYRFLAVAVCCAQLLAADSTLVGRVLGDIARTPSGIATEPIPSLVVSSASIAAIIWMSGSDDAIRSAVMRSHSPAFNTLARIGNTLGDVPSAAAVSLALIVGGAACGSDHTITSGRQLLEALALAGAVTTTLKLTIGRARPFRERGDGFFTPFRWDDAQWSFPSGHTTVAGTIVGIALARSDNWLVRSAAVLGALTTMTARVWSDKHWTSDTIVGATIGSAIGYGLARSDHDAHTWMIVPAPDGIGVTATW
ncbi:MAG: phosphatase PAP2 family protein [Chlorobi bacterium]|nr:phosphatase PAP2 family protein [Chlorobiota bacterium]